ncbi:sugar-transfer associated ATP-grasp domain-containing protein [Photobacterium phosphoreum]|uniref:sugar-transfer associated ATP-grasp domain-containing protein n=1 Tax=Photobacterium phosphoreum TaxID=659 RepID=UPI0039B0C34E
MKDSFARRFAYEVLANVRFIKYGIKNPKSLKCKNMLSPLTGRFWNYRYQSVCGIESDKYLSEPYFYNKLEAKVNDFGLNEFFDHKGYLSNILNSNTIPTIANCIAGTIYDNDNEVIVFNDLVLLLEQLPSNSEFVIKRSIGTGGGNSVEIGVANHIVPFLKTYFNAKYDFVIQPVITQHDDLAIFNPSSINTVRVMSFAYQGNVYPVSTVLRMGNGGRIDNSAAGGISIGVDNTGKLRDFAIDHDFKKYYQHPATAIKFSDGYFIPYFNELLDLVKDKHRCLKSHGIVSWDLTVDNDGNMSIIEYNAGWGEINFHQANNGPIFENHIKHIKSINK